MNRVTAGMAVVLDGPKTSEGPSGAAFCAPLRAPAI